MTTAADLYRALAADGLTPAQIARQTGAKLQSVHSAINKQKGRGRPRKRCARCTCATCGGTWEPSRLRKGATT
jgi:DNA invertase Pin-like site-specific DNA recombinase